MKDVKKKKKLEEADDDEESKFEMWEEGYIEKDKNLNLKNWFSEKQVVYEGTRKEIKEKI